MPDQLQLRGGTTAQHSSFTGASKEVTVDTTKKTLVVHDGSTAGGNPVMREDGSNSAFALGSAGAPAIKFSGDTNTGIYSPGADQVAISVNGAEKVRVTPTGLGVGTSSPSEALTVAGNIRANNTNATIGAYGANSSSPQFVLGNSAGTLHYSIYETIDGSGNRGALNIYDAVAAANRVTVDSSGRVGVGTATFSAVSGLSGAKLQVTAGAIFGNDGASSNGSGWIAFDSACTAPATTKPLVYHRQGVGLGLLTDSAISFEQGATERARIDSSGRLLVGTSSTRSNLFGGNAALPAYHLVEGALDNGKRTSAFVYGAGSNSGPLLVLAAHASSSVGGTTAVTNGWETGTIDFQGADGTNFVPAARIQAVIDGTPGANDMPGRLVFSTTADGASSPTERMRLTSTGQLRLAGAGITFNGDTAAANELDDYEEGTWTPSIAFGGSSAGITYFSQSAVYTKVGNKVTLSGLINLTSKGTSTGSATIAGLPFTTGPNAGDRAGGAIDFASITYTGQVAIHVNSSATSIVLSQITEAGSYTELSNTNFTNSSIIWFSVSYRVA